MQTGNPEFAAHFEHLAAARLCFPCCADCQRFHWYPMPLCPHCQSSRLSWQQVSGRGTLYSWTEIHHAFDVRYHGPLPYIVALIDVNDAPGVRLVCNLVGASSAALAIDMAVTADFSKLVGGDGQLVFRPLVS